jgi:hypothetical protein
VHGPGIGVGPEEPGGQPDDTVQLPVQLGQRGRQRRVRTHPGRARRLSAALTTLLSPTRQPQWDAKSMTPGAGFGVPPGRPVTIRTTDDHVFHE